MEQFFDKKNRCSEFNHMSLSLITISLIFILSFSTCRASFVLKQKCYHFDMIVAYVENTQCIDEDVYYLCNEGIPYEYNCDDEVPLALPAECENDVYEFSFKCIDNLNNYPSTIFIHKHIYYDDNVYKIEIYKPYDCNNKEIYFIGGDTVYHAFYDNDECLGNPTTFYYKLDTIINEITNTFKFEYTIHSMYKYLERNNHDPDRFTYFRTNRCLDSTKYFAYKDGNKIKINFDPFGCTENPIPSFIDGDAFGTDNIKYGKEYCYVYQYNTYDECIEDIDNSPHLYVINCDKRLCLVGRVLHEMSYNSTHYNVTKSLGPEGSFDCDNAEISQSIQYVNTYTECFMVEYIYDEEHKIPIKLGKNKLLNFDDVTCENGSCESNSIVNITEGLISML